ncbi:MAG: RNA polymerase sigma factor [Prevotella sp.]|uniref:RNA polymerase sigma factor n=1 Tax=Prevotella sp. P5-92 TaxID=2024222 RepID=UPI000B9786A0|nr:sigma-70 family RNA polymerase sigma factor [Prevotella sp. P5-92]MCI7400038.1 sigma-70 family RNA polymerase sigma factor [Prevotella sp.]MDD6820281.1 sigma-70 family RNA polymerase sigma factor [Prevotella sp.]MDY4653779.1 sigma-70 family RNA polymerase sigma factor [Prevotella sp.]OYP56788.1 RNA polymerase subunit sigma-70 [Prevotella sp. P5-92]
MDNSEQLFSNLVREHKSTIYTVCYMFSKDNDEVADLFQEILIKLWKGFQSFEGRSDIKTWVYRVSLNTCISLDRKKKRRKKSDSLAMDINLYDDNDSDTRQVKQLYERINRLGVFDRAIILLWLEGIPYDEIADIVGISTKNVSVKLYRIREQLKNMK